jgi:NADPH:quinone reductase-like Zn-dependent oxidoreductase
MKAVLHHEAGGPEVLRYVDVPDPEPGPLDVVVRVAACALNRLDIVQRNGWFQLPGFTYPHIAGMDVAGEIVAVGPSVTGVRLGDRVVVDPSLAGVPEGSRLAGRGDRHGELGIIGGTVPGGYAELCLAPSTHVYPVPDDLPLEQAATFPTCFLTAAHALFDVGRLRAGETVMIHAAGSGVSVAGILLAKHAGATVLATAGGARKLERALALGADQVVDNRTADVAAFALAATDGRGVDLVLDHVGTALFGGSLAALAVGGRLVTCGNTSGDSAAIPSLGHLFHGRRSILGSDAYRPEEFGPVWETFCTARFPVVIDREYPLDEAGAAQARLEAGDVFGKIVLRP